MLDERLFSHMGIPAGRWNWTPGQVVHDTPDWYPDMPGYGGFIDPPYEIDGHVVRGGPGWVLMGLAQRPPCVERRVHNLNSYPWANEAAFPFDTEWFLHGSHGEKLCINMRRADL